MIWCSTEQPESDNVGEAGGFNFEGFDYGAIDGFEGWGERG